MTKESSNTPNRVQRLERIRIDPEFRAAVVDDLDWCRDHISKLDTKYHAIRNLFLGFIKNQMTLLPGETPEQRLEYLLMLAERKETSERGGDA